MTPDNLSTTFTALTDPTRRVILARLSSGEASVTELAEPFDLSLPAISKHLKVLERAGLVARRSGGPAGLNRVRSRTSPTGSSTTAASYEESFDRLDDYLREIQTEKKQHDGNRTEEE